MSLLGFNFSFGARDDGFSSALGRAGSGLKNVSGQVDSLADKISTGNFFQALNTMHLSKLGDQLSELKGRGQQLETSLEGTFRNMSAEVRPMLAQMGLTQKEFSKASSEIVSTADTLNVGASEVAQSFRAISRTGDNTKKVLKSMGIEMKELTLIQKATGMGAEEFTGLITNLTDSYGFSTEEAKDFLDGFTGVAQGLGIADVAFGSLSNTMTTLDQTLASNVKFGGLSREKQQEHVKEQVMGVQKLTKAFMTLGKTPQEAQTSALKFFETINTEKKNINDMTIGIGDMGATFKSLAEEAGFKDVEKLFSDISTDPVEALEQIMGMQEALQEAGDPQKLARFNSKLQDMMGGLSFMKDAGKGFRENLKKVNEASTKTGDGLVGMAKKAHTANRGLDEVLSRMEDRFETSLMKLTGNTRTRFVQRQKAMYGVVREEAKKLASNETWGPLFKQFVSARKIGASAFFHPVERDSKQLKKAISGVSSALDKGGILGRLEAIKTLGFAGFFLDLKDDYRFLSDVEMMESAEEASGRYFARLQALGLASDTLRPALIALGTAFAGLFVFVKSASALSGALSIMGTALTVLGPIAGVVGGAVLAIATSPVVIAGAIAGAIVGAVYAIGEGIKYLANAPKEFFDGIATAIDGVADYLDDAFNTIMDIDVSKMTNEWLDQLEKWVVGVFQGVGKFFSDSSKWMPVVKSIGRFFEKLGVFLLSMLVKLGEIFVTLGTRMGGWLKDAFWFAIDGLNSIGHGIMKKMGSFFKAWVVDPIKGAFDSVVDTIMSPFNFLIGFFKTSPLMIAFRDYVWMPLSRFLDSVVDLFVQFFNWGILEPVSYAINKLIETYNYLASFVPMGAVDEIKSRVDFRITRDKFSDTALPKPKVQSSMKSNTLEVSVDDTVTARESRKQTKLLETIAGHVKPAKGQNATQTPLPLLSPVPLR